MDKINDNAFRVMCNMWGVDKAVKAAARMGMKPTQKQIETEKRKEMESQERWNGIFKPKEGT